MFSLCKQIAEWVASNGTGRLSDSIFCEALRFHRLGGLQSAKTSCAQHTARTMRAFQAATKSWLYLLLTRRSCFTTAMHSERLQAGSSDVGLRSPAATISSALKSWSKTASKERPYSAVHSVLRASPRTCSYCSGWHTSHRAASL